MEGNFLRLQSTASLLTFFVTRNRLQLYGSGNLSRVVTLDVPQTIEKDLEIVDYPGFISMLDLWCTNLKLGASDAVIIFSEDVYFVKEALENDSEDKAMNEANTFIQSVPFEHSAVKRFSIGSAKQLVAANERYMTVLIDGLRTHDITVLGVVPVFVLEGQGAKRVLDPDMAKYVSSHLDTLKPMSIVPPERPRETPSKEVEVFAKKNQRFVVFLGVFVVLIIVLAILLLLR